MKQRLLAFGRSREGKRALVAGVLLAVAAALVAPNATGLWESPFPLALLAAVAAYLPRKWLSDAAGVGVAILAAEVVESRVGPQVLACLVLFPMALTRRPRFSAFLGAGMFLLLLVSIRLKDQFAGTPLTWQDLRFFFRQFHDNVGVMASQPTLLAYAALAIITLLGVLVLFWRWDGAVGAGRGAGARYWAPALSMVLVAWSASQAADAAVVQRQLGVWQVSETRSSISPLSRFLATANLEPVADVMRVDTGSFQRRSRPLPAAAAAAVPADMVVLLQESQFNPAMIENCPARLCDLPVFRGGAHTVAQGPLRVHVFGGGTWLTEFSLFSGVPHTLFGPAGDFAPFNVAPGLRRSFARSLQSAGYRTVAVYPVRGGMMNARKAYEAYGFDQFYDSTDLGLPGRYNTSDELVHAAALRVLDQERQHGKPVFLMVVTIFNHGEHGVAMDRVPAALVRDATLHFSDPQVANNVADFVWRTREFQKAMESTTRAVLGSGRPTVLAWFGDHQPPFGNAMALRAMIRSAMGPSVNTPARYQAWYHVASNIRGRARQVAPEALDIAFLPGALAQAAGVKLDDWLAANVAARDLCHGLLAECREPQARDAYLSYLMHDLQSFDLR